MSDGTPPAARVPGACCLIRLAVAVASGNAFLAADILAVGPKIVLRLLAPALRSIRFFGVVLRVAHGAAEVHRLVAQVDAGWRRDGWKRGILFAECHDSSFVGCVERSGTHLLIAIDLLVRSVPSGELHAPYPRTLPFRGRLRAKPRASRRLWPAAPCSRCWTAAWRWRPPLHRRLQPSGQ